MEIKANLATLGTAATSATAAAAGNDNSSRTEQKVEAKGGQGRRKMHFPKNSDILHLSQRQPLFARR